MPIWRRRDLDGLVMGLLIQGCITVPGNTLICHNKGSWLVTAWWVDSDGAKDGVVEDGVGDQSAGVVSFSVVVQLQRIAGGTVYGAIALRIAFELIGVERLDISSVILVEVCKLVIEVHMWSNIIRNVELKSADSGLGDVDGAVWRFPRIGGYAPLWPGEV